MIGRKNATADLSAQWDDADAAQEKIQTAQEDSAIIDCRFRLETLVGSQEFLFKGLVTTANPTADNDGVSHFVSTIRVTGPVTRQPQV